MISYEQWNEALCETVFDSKKQDKTVYLYVNQNLLQQIGSVFFGLSHLEVENSFCLAVKSYCTYVDELFEKAVIRGKKWFSQGGKGYPPFIGILSLCVLAATKMERDILQNIGGGNYYFRLRELLGIENDGDGKPRRFERMRELWQILRDWQNRNDGKYGYTPVFSFGTRHTLYPRSQCLVKDNELEDFFRFAGYEGHVPNRQLVAYDLERYLHPRSNLRLSRMFFSVTEETVQEAIVEIVLEEYMNWIPSTEVRRKARERSIDWERPRKIMNSQPTSVHVSLMLMMEQRFVTNHINLSIFTPLPEFEESTSLSNGFECKHGFIRQKLQEGFCYEKNQEFHIEEINYKLIFRGQSIFVFRHGGDLGFKGWVARNDLSSGFEYLLLYEELRSNDVESWLTQNRIKHLAMSRMQGIPTGWALIKVKIEDDSFSLEELNRGSNLFKKIERVDLRLEGGLKIGSDKWLVGAAPILEISAPSHSEFAINREAKFSIIDEGARVPLDHIVNCAGTYILKVGNILKKFDLVVGDINRNSTDVEIQRYTSVLTNGVVAVGSDHMIGRQDSFPLLNPPNCYRFQDMGVILLKGLPAFERPIDLLVEYLSVLGHGTWNRFLQAIQWCFGRENLYLNAYYVRRALIQMGIVKFEGDKNYQNYSWQVLPPAAALLPINESAEVYVCLTGARTRGIVDHWSNLADSLSDHKFYYSEPTQIYEPISIYLQATNCQEIGKTLDKMNVLHSLEGEYFARRMTEQLPSLQELLEGCSPVDLTRHPQEEVRDWIAMDTHSWGKMPLSGLKVFVPKYGAKQYFIRIGTMPKLYYQADLDLGKTYIASRKCAEILAYDSYELSIKMQYTLPDMYEYVLSMCSGCIPFNTQGYRVFRNVPYELALLVAEKLNLKLKDNRGNCDARCTWNF